MICEQSQSQMLHKIHNSVHNLHMYKIYFSKLLLHTHII